MTETNQQKEIYNLLRGTVGFSNASEASLDEIISASQEVILNQGQTLLRGNLIETHAFVIMEGCIRLLSVDKVSNELYTVGFSGPNEVVGIIDLLRQGACEAAIAKQPSKLLSIPLELIAKLIKYDEGLYHGLESLYSPCEAAEVLSYVLGTVNPQPEDRLMWIKNQIKSNQDIQGERQGNHIKLLSTVIDNYENKLGREISDDEKMVMEEKTIFPLRFYNYIHDTDIEIRSEENTIKMKKDTGNSREDLTVEKKWVPQTTLDMKSLGIKEAQTEADLQGFKILRGKGIVSSNLATLRMVARAYSTPCPVDVIEKTLEGAAERAGTVPIQAMGQLAESMGLQTQVGSVSIQKLRRLELPVMINVGANYALLADVKNDTLLIADPEHGWVKKSFNQAETLWGERIEVILIKRLETTPQKTFGWGWFTPVVKRFQWPLVQVLLASLFIQLFQLANPLLLQQIIDKVINQSNLSALQVLGAALVAAALFQGLLTAVRTWLLIDTTDRMDLILGSQVIDKLLRLPLRFFEKRPVGELSQRLSELANLRNFLTGTAITTTLDLLFATIYIIIMFVYSPLLTAVALGTVPLYVGMILFIAPLYRKLIRRQAQYAARTQSHLIETLSGIQTVKAQHFELNSRWRWQERYSGQIAEGFKSVVLGSSAGEVGNFLNQLSSLLIIWVGVYQVVNGELSLGQLIAFRIIAGYVTGPILRLSGLWQGFQQVGISMERLADIVDQVPEAGEHEENQISLPPIKGKVKFENLKFNFTNQGPNQIDGIDLEIGRGSFVGIVGQSGSGKSTLMKLLPRLYEPNEGRILVDDYDISKVTLNSVRQQIGIVPQDCLLFEGTISENISMNNSEADTESIIRVAKAAAAHEFIMELPNGYGTKLGERGAGLSGGQKQRIAIARTLLQNPNLLVLDEATSALDYDTESTVCKNLQNCLQNKTVFFITHRLSTVRNADQIILMHKGKIAEMGTHEDLIKLGGRYSALYAHQGDA